MDADDAWERFCKSEEAFRKTSLEGKLDTIAAMLQEQKASIDRLDAVVPKLMGDDEAIGDVDDDFESSVADLGLGSGDEEGQMNKDEFDEDMAEEDEDMAEEDEDMAEEDEELPPIAPEDMEGTPSEGGGVSVDEIMDMALRGARDASASGNTADLMMYAQIADAIDNAQGGLPGGEAMRPVMKSVKGMDGPQLEYIESSHGVSGPNSSAGSENTKGRSPPSKSGASVASEGVIGSTGVPRSLDGETQTTGAPGPKEHGGDFDKDFNSMSKSSHTDSGEGMRARTQGDANPTYADDSPDIDLPQDGSQDKYLDVTSKPSKGSIRKAADVPFRVIWEAAFRKAHDLPEADTNTEKQDHAIDIAPSGVAESDDGSSGALGVKSLKDFGDTMEMLKYMATLNPDESKDFIERCLQEGCGHGHGPVEEKVVIIGGQPDDGTFAEKAWVDNKRYDDREFKNIFGHRIGDPVIGYDEDADITNKRYDESIGKNGCTGQQADELVGAFGKSATGLPSAEQGPIEAPSARTGLPSATVPLEMQRRDTKIMKSVRPEFSARDAVPPGAAIDAVYREGFAKSFSNVPMNERSQDYKPIDYVRGDIEEYKFYMSQHR